MHGSAVDLAGLVRSGELSAAELLEDSLAAIERLNPELNAFVALCPDRARAEAAAIRPGDPRPLCGVPIGLKDLLSATDGLPTTHGSAAFGDWVAGHDSAHVRRLREAGAIVVGKTNSPELGLRPVTENTRFGVTRNPHDPSLSPGGSSGGSAAAVASGMVPLADGSDFGGSIRIPASCCGLVGLKPSRGRVSIGPDFGLVGAGMPSDGVLASCVRDAEVALGVMAGYEPGDHHFLPPLAPVAPRPVRVRLALTAPHGVPVDPEPRAAAERAAAALADAGHDVVEGAPDWDDPSFPPSWATFATGAMQHIIRVLERLHGRPLDPDGLEPATRGWLLGTPPVTLIDHLEASERLWAFSRRLLRGWGDDEVLLTPTLTRLPAPIGTSAQAGVSDDAVRFSVLVRIFNVTGQPAASVPFGEADGIPVGVQLAGPPGRDDLVLALAAQLEERSAAIRS
jgi:amidase